MKDKVVALIDADVTAFKACTIAEKEIDWGDDVWTLHSDLNEALDIAVSDIERLLERIGAESAVLAFTDSVNWRKEVLPSYKSNRKNTRKPVAYKPLVERLKAEYIHFQRPGLEGDDLLGILATNPRFMQGHEKVVVSIDKDMRTLPVMLFNPDKDEKPWRQTQHGAHLWHMVQTLTGDTTDGYKGCPGIGEVKAHRALQDLDIEDMWPAVVGLFEKAGLNEAAALIQARVARILQVQDYDPKTQKPILWTPTT